MNTDGFGGTPIMKLAYDLCADYSLFTSKLIFFYFEVFFYFYYH